jgi:predicted dehydrogenase
MNGADADNANGAEMDSNMIGIGIIGTNSISERFCNAALDTGEYSLTAVYSRGEGSGGAFAAQFPGMRAYTDFGRFVASPDIQAVYVASPNSLHYSHARAALEAGKHVIAEKPAFTNGAQARRAFALAERNGAMLFEAARHIHTANFGKLKDAVAAMGGGIAGASLNFSKYSPRYDVVLAGGEPNVFSLNFAGGALYDLGIYLVYDAIALFGVPRESHYFCTKVRTGVDGRGAIAFRYDGFDVLMEVSKITTSYLASEIYSADATIELDSAHDIGSITLRGRAGGSARQLAAPKNDNFLYEEAAAFAGMLSGKGGPGAKIRYEYLKKLSLDVHDAMESLRNEAGIRFPGDARR